MSSLAGPLYTEPPAGFQQTVRAPSEEYATLLWHGLAPSTRRNYNSAIQSYTKLCQLLSILPWPATPTSLGLFITARSYGQLNFSRVTANTIQGYLSALRSVHVDRQLNLSPFEDEHVRRLVKGARNLFPQAQKRERFPITKDLLTRLLSADVALEGRIDSIHLSASFALAFAAFLRMGEFTYTAAQAGSRAFAHTQLTRGDIHFAEGLDYITLTLKRSKTDRDNQGVSIVIAAVPGDPACPVTLIRRLFGIDPQPPTAPLFRFSSRVFTRPAVINALHVRLNRLNVNIKGFSGHSFRKGATQHAHDSGLLSEHIQTLGRWTSDSFKLYYTASPTRLYELNRQFQTGRPPRIAAAIPPAVALTFPTN